MASRRAVLLMNLGTPDSPRPSDVRRYLREFLGDPRVLDMPGPLRALFLYGAILPFRPRVAADAYAKIWGPEGSPLLVHSRALRGALASQLGDGYQVELAMRYGKPSLSGAVERLARSGAESILVVPLFPHFAASSTGSALAAVYRCAGKLWNPPHLEVLPPYFEAPRFIDCLAGAAREAVGQAKSDHLLISFHGLPERQIRKSDPSGSHCLSRPDCCEQAAAPRSVCYRAQSRATARALAVSLGLSEGEWSLSFQSRLGRIPWLRPYTDEVLPELAQRGVRHLAVSCPAFTADCLETLEEIGIRASEQWQTLGGSQLTLVPSLNSRPDWVHALADWIRARG
jgi:ferrochelatase